MDRKTFREIQRPREDNRRTERNNGDAKAASKQPAPAGGTNYFRNGGGVGENILKVICSGVTPTALTLK